jgi:acylphosphatase
MRRVRVVVTGRVQGVFYRATCAREAEDRGIAGWVRNLPGGDVEAVFEGSSPQVEAMIAWCRGGPPGARVDTVEVRDEPPAGERGFRVGG